MDKKNKIIKIVIISVTVFLVTLIISWAIILMIKNNNETTTTTRKANNTTASTDGIYHLTPIEGTTELSDERKGLLDRNIATRIEQMKNGFLVIDENGNYQTDENGYLLYENNFGYDADELEANLYAVINIFADKGYSEESILLIQKFYFEYYHMLSGYTSETAINMIIFCFESSGNTKESISEKALEIFMLEREDSFAFLWEDVIAATTDIPAFCDVSYNKKSIANQNDYCIYSKWTGDETYNRNLENYLKVITAYFTNEGYTEWDIKLAQLIFATAIFDTEYNRDFLHSLQDCILYGEPDFGTLCENVTETFGLDISENILIQNYYNGTEIFN